MEETTLELMLKNIESQVTQINENFKEFKKEVTDKTDVLKENWIRCDEQIKTIKLDINNSKTDLCNLGKNINTLDKKNNKQVGIMTGAFTVISIGIQFILKFIK